MPQGRKSTKQKLNASGRVAKMQQQSLQALRKQQLLNDLNLIDSVALHERATSVVDDDAGDVVISGQTSSVGAVPDVRQEPHIVTHQGGDLTANDTTDGICESTVFELVTEIAKSFLFIIIYKDHCLSQDHLPMKMLALLVLSSRRVPATFFSMQMFWKT